jgi:hypothetical protein
MKTMLQRVVLAGVLTCSLTLVHAATNIVIDKSLMGSSAGGGIVGIGDASLDVRVIIGQPIVSMEKNLSPSETKVRLGYWLEVAELPVLPVTQEEVSRSANMGAQFSGDQVVLRFELTRAQVASATLRSMDGKLLGTLWNGELGAGVSQLTRSLQAWSGQPVVLEMRSQTQRKAYRFIEGSQ